MAKLRLNTVLSFGNVSQFAFWISLFSFILYLSIGSFGWPEALHRSLLIIGCHLINFYFIYSIVIPRYFEKGSYAKAIVALIILFMTLTPLRYVIEQQFTLLTTSTPGRLFSRTGNILFLVFSEMTIGGFAALLRLAIDHEKNKRKIVELEKVQIETELQFLKAQMSPHFLFNIINNIYSLTLIKSDKAPESLMKLSGLLRYILYESHGKVPLHKEMNALYSYKELFELKYEVPLPITMSEHLMNRDAFIEPILLIPLLENAFKHSGLGYWEEAYVVFEIKDSANSITAKIENSKQRNAASAEPGGIGLENIKRRLEKVYAGRHELLIEDLTDKYIVQLKIPVG